MPSFFPLQPRSCQGGDSDWFVLSCKGLEAPCGLEGDNIGWYSFMYPYLLIFTPNLGEMIQFDEHIFSNGLVQPPTCDKTSDMNDG